MAIDLFAAAAQEGVNPQRLSRLCSRALASLEQVVAALARRGRPPRDHDRHARRSEVPILRALLVTATSLLRQISWRSPVLRSLVVGACLRLEKKHPELTRQRFCQALALSPRTLRHWLRNHRVSTRPITPSAPTAPNKKPRPPRRPRFSLSVTIPGTQLAADTTDIQAFDIPLKLVAAQDIGGRDQDLLEAVVVDDHESADLVVEVITKAVADRPGIQVLTDQGSPYMAELTRRAIEQMEAEHAPQVEGEPTGKATVERAFRGVKDIARPLLELTSRIARIVPGLRSVDLAKAVTTLVLTALLKAYQAGARATARAQVERALVSTEQLAKLAQQSRLDAQATSRSARLLLTSIHKDFAIARPLAAFIRSLRRFPLPVLRKAQEAFARQAHRDDIKNRAGYFTAIVIRINEEHQRHAALVRAQRETVARIEQHHRQHDALLAAWRARPDIWLTEALDAIAAQWLPRQQRLLGDGQGAGRVWMEKACLLLEEQCGQPAAVDIIAGVFRDFASANHDRLGPNGIAAVRQLLQRHLPHGAGDEGAQGRLCQQLHVTGLRGLLS